MKTTCLNDENVEHCLLNESIGRGYIYTISIKFKKETIGALEQDAQLMLLVRSYHQMINSNSWNKLHFFGSNQQRGLAS